MAKRKKGYGIGSVERLASGRWRARIPDGHGGYESLGTFANEQDALDARDGALVDRSRGDHVPLSGITVAQYAEDWLAWKATPGPHKVRQRTWEGYQGVIKNQIRPHLGHRLLHELDYTIIEQWLQQLHKETGPAQVALSYRVLRPMLNHAVRHRKIRFNPCMVEGAGVHTAPEREIPSVEQVFALLDAVQPSRRALIATAAFGGLRLGEVLGLTRRNVAPDGSWVRVKQGANEAKNGAKFVDDPKSSAGRRKVHMPDTAQPFILDHLNNHTGSDRDAWLFTGVRGGLLRRGVWHDEWSAARESVDGCEEMHYHDLRHFYGTMATLAAGGALKDVMKALGQSSPRAAMIYQHATDKGAERIVKGLNEMLRRPDEGPEDQQVA